MCWISKFRPSTWVCSSSASASEYDVVVSSDPEIESAMNLPLSEKLCFSLSYVVSVSADYWLDYWPTQLRVFKFNLSMLLSELPYLQSLLIIGYLTFEEFRRRPALLFDTILSSLTFHSTSFTRFSSPSFFCHAFLLYFFSLFSSSFVLLVSAHLRRGRNLCFIVVDFLHISLLCLYFFSWVFLPMPTSSGARCNSKLVLMNLRARESRKAMVNGELLGEPPHRTKSSSSSLIVFCVGFLLALSFSSALHTTHRTPSSRASRSMREAHFFPMKFLPTQSMHDRERKR